MQAISRYFNFFSPRLLYYYPLYQTLSGYMNRACIPTEYVYHMTWDFEIKLKNYRYLYTINSSLMMNCEMGSYKSPLTETLF